MARFITGCLRSESDFIIKVGRCSDDIDSVPSVVIFDGTEAPFKVQSTLRI